MSWRIHHPTLSFTLGYCATHLPSRGCISFLHFLHTRITDPSLAIGVTDTEKVKHSDFSYEIQSKSYSKASSEVALTGSAIPQGKYGAWSLKIDEDGLIAVAAAADNATGYDTPRKALESLGVSDSDSAYMGYVTVTKSDGAFTPDTTALNATNVTATFTDGKFENRGEPLSALLYGRARPLYLWGAMEFSLHPYRRILPETLPGRVVQNICKYFFFAYG